MLVGCALLCLAAHSGCATQIDRLAFKAEQVSTSAGADAADTVYRRNLGTLIARAAVSRLGNMQDIPAGAGPDAAPEEASSRYKLARLAEPAHQAGEPAVVRAARGPARRTFTAAWRTSRQDFYLGPAGEDAGDMVFAFSGREADKVEIALRPVGGAAYRLKLVCDGPLEVSTPLGRNTYGPGDDIWIWSERQDDSRPLHVLAPSPSLNRCEGWTKFSRHGRRLVIERQEVVAPELTQLDARYDLCVAPDGARSDPLDIAFFAPGWMSQTCPFELGKADFLTDQRAGFDAKVAALLGRPLPAAFYKIQNPELPLDFTHAPRLSLIYVSYLDIKADFSGRLLDRLLRHHAARGTTIRIVTSDVLVRDKDRAMLEGLAADYPNVQFKAFKWSAPAGSSLSDRISTLHRVHHVKLLVALSPDPGRSAAILGGRNIHDGFLFDEPVDLTAFPKLQQYGRRGAATLNYYSNWRDYDLSLHDGDTVRLLASHLSTLWHEDAVTRIARPFSVSAFGRARHVAGLARHFISVPYADGRALERYYVALFDAAREKIEIVNPYFNATDSVRAALERALARGVRITVVGRISQAGDLGGGLTTAVNEEFVERYVDKIEIWNHQDPRALLHAKIFLVDGRLSVISGVNLNSRSFIHDTENGLVVLDPAFYRRAHQVFTTFKAASERITTPGRRSAWRLLLHSPLIREAL
jgi:cardiolipin synthase A/B